MAKRILRVLGITLLALLVLSALAYAVRRDPLGPISGRALTGQETAYPGDWSFSDDHFTIAIETRPEDPHSVTTVCFVHEGALYVPAQAGSEKRWTQYVLDDPRVRLKVGESLFAGRAMRVAVDDASPFIESAAKKYPQMGLDDGELPEDTWLFRVDPPE